jgi:phosphomannomutase/phosphoglucomutase
MISKTIFRQYDIRGIVNEDLTTENSKLIGYFLGLTIKEKICKSLFLRIDFVLPSRVQSLGIATDI